MRIDYLAIDERGAQVKGGLEATDTAGAAAQLRAQGLFPLELTPGRGGALAAAPGWLPAYVRSADVVLFLSQLALMLRTGLTLLQALETLERSSSRAGLRRVAQRLSQTVSGGRPLSAGLEVERALFPPIAVQLVRTAEATGELADALDQSAEYLERRAALQMQLMTSMTYPALVLLIGGATFWFLTTKVLPKFAAFLAARGGTLPTSTQLLLDVSAFMQAWGGGVLAALALSVAALLVLRRTTRGRLATDRVGLSLPIVGALLRSAAQAHLGRTLGVLLRSGLPLVESLRLVSESYSNRCYGDLVLRARERVVQGMPLASSLEHAVVSAMTTQVVAVGEQTGALDDVLLQLGEFFDRRLQAHVRTLSALVEPAIIVVVGGMVGFVYLSFFQALFSLVGRR